MAKQIDEPLTPKAHRQDEQGQDYRAQLPTPKPLIDEGDLSSLRDGIIETLADEIFRLSQEATPLAEVQPPSSVCLLAAQAAADVLIAFERGYRMSDGR